MVPHRRILFLLLAVVGVPLALIGACDRVPLLAPTGTVITILPATNTVSLNSQIQIVATAIQNGVASSGTGSGATTTTSTGGQPVQNGTVISFTTTIGTIQPQEARTHDGQVTVTLATSNQSGTATITAYSGGASSSIKLAVGTAAVSNILLSATPASLGASGGTAQVTAQVLDEGGSGIAGVPVTFTTDQGTLTPSTATTDTNGNATVALNTTASATINAAAGAKTATALKVPVQARSLTSITASPSSTTAGTPVSFTIALGTNANVSNIHLDFGDGSSTDLGANTTASHPYSAPGIYTATATANDGSRASTQVTIGSLPVTLTANPPTATRGTPIAFTVGGVPSSVAVQSYVFTFDDGTTETETSPQDSHIFGSPGARTAQVTVIGVDGGTLGKASVVVQIT